MPLDPDGTALDELLRDAIFESRAGLSERITSDPAAYLEVIEVAAAARVATSEILGSAVQAARGAGNSWEAIGARLGMTRQAAQQRFAGETIEPGIGETRKLSPLTAFDEMEVLAREGTYGWHSIGFGTLYHLVERSEVQWEHLRVLATSTHRRALEREGWSRIGSMWFPWAYYGRKTALPALPIAL